MPTKSAFYSPRLDLEITEEQHAEACQSNSGGCLIADAIRKQYPHLSGITVDMATIRVSDRKTGMRYTYLTPADAQHVLLSFDQGWPNPTNRLRIRKAVKITPIRTAKNNGKDRGVYQGEARAARIAELEAKESDGILTRAEKQALTVLRKNPEGRPSAYGKKNVKVRGDQSATVLGGRPLPQGKAHPNLLRGRDRHFGAKLSDPGQAFNEALEAALAERQNQAPTQS